MIHLFICRTRFPEVSPLPEIARKVVNEVEEGRDQAESWQEVSSMTGLKLKKVSISQITRSLSLFPT